MNAPAPAPQCFGFSFPRLDTVVQVECSSAGVVIRASRDSFSEERKASFVRELAAEGFIDDVYRWRVAARADNLRWVVDTAPFLPGPACVAETRRLVLGLLLSAALLLTLLMSMLFSGALRAH